MVCFCSMWILITSLIIGTRIYSTWYELLVVDTTLFTGIYEHLYPTRQHLVVVAQP